MGMDTYTLLPSKPLIKKFQEFQEVILMILSMCD